jgi:hypothetical protein
MKIWTWFWYELGHLAFRKWMNNNNPDDVTWLIRSHALQGIGDHPEWFKSYWVVFVHGKWTH